MNLLFRYKKVIKFSISSIISFIIDYSLFSIFSIFIKNISLCNIFARVISSIVNYLMNRKYVFKSNTNFYKSFFSYVVLAIIILTLNTFLLNIFIYKLLINKFISKIMVEIILFIFNFLIQKKYIFGRSVNKSE